MKKLLLASAAVVGMAAVSSPAVAADGVSLDLGGHFKGYVVYHDQDTSAGSDHRDLDMLRETEVHFTGETTLDNGLTVGAHVEADVDGSDSFDVDESYAYFSGSWGRVNLGDEDGAAYLLQVAAPSADSNVDGIRQFVNPVNYTLTSLNATTAATAWNATGLDYDNDFTDNADKVTYLSPVMNGFQLGASYTFDTDNNATGGIVTTRDLTGVSADDETDEYGEAWELAARYEGQFDEVGFTFGAGYTDVQREDETTATNDDFTEWNVGLDLNWSAFGLGVVYTENNNGLDTTDNNETMVVGVDYTTGAYKLGASWLNNETDVNGATSEVETDRYTGGVVYTYGPGMTFRGSISYVEHDVQGAADVEATSVLLGTQINF